MKKVPPTAGKQNQKSLLSRYEPNARERTAVASQRARRARAAPAPRITAATKDGKYRICNDHPDTEMGFVLLMEALGTADPDFTDGLISSLVNLASTGQSVDTRTTNIALSIVRGIQPRDEVEAMLATQMAAVHLATMTFARRLAHVENIPQQDSAERAFNKLARTFATQMEALKRYRNGGEQRVTVRHVTVNEGGQAIVGSVSGQACSTEGRGIPG